MGGKSLAKGSHRGARKGKMNPRTKAMIGTEVREGIAKEVVEAAQVDKAAARVERGVLEEEMVEMKGRKEEMMRIETEEKIDPTGEETKENKMSPDPRQGKRRIIKKGTETLAQGEQGGVRQKKVRVVMTTKPGETGAGEGAVREVA